MDIEKQFPGFSPEIKRNFWMFPQLMDLYRHQLSPQENLALTFILRRTIGYQKLSDKISLTQFETGVGKNDKGTGMSRKTIIKSIKGLEKKGFIIVLRGGKINEYSLVLCDKENSVHLGIDSVSNGNREHGVEGAHTINKNSIERIQKIYKIYSKYIRSGMRLTKEAKENIGDRLLEYSPYELIVAMRNASEHEEYWKSVVETTTPAWFFKDEERISKFIALGPYKWSENQNDEDQ